MKQIFIIITTILIVFITFNLTNKTVSAFTRQDYEIITNTTGTTAEITVDIKSGESIIDKVDILKNGELEDAKSNDNGTKTTYTFTLNELEYNTTYKDYSVVFIFNDGTTNLEESIEFKTEKYKIENLSIVHNLKTNYLFVYKLDEEDYNITKFLNDISSQITEDVKTATFEIYERVDNTTSKIMTLPGDEVVMNASDVIDKIENSVELIDKFTSNTNETITNLEYQVQITHGGETVTELIKLNIQLMGYKMPTMFHPQFLIDLVFVFLVPELDSDLISDDMSGTLRGISSQAVEFSERVHAYLAIVAIPVFVFFFLKKLFDKYSDTKAFSPKEIVKFMFALVLIKLAIDQSFFIAEIVYNFFALFISGIYNIKLSEFFDNVGYLVDTEYIIQQTVYISERAYSSNPVLNLIGRVESMFISTAKSFNPLESLKAYLRLFIVLSTLVLYLKLILNVFIILVKRYFLVLILIITSPLTLATLIDDKVNRIGKNAIKKFCIKLMHGLVLGIGIYLVVILVISLRSMLDTIFADVSYASNFAFDLGLMVLALAIPIMMDKLISELDNFTEALFGIV